MLLPRRRRIRRSSKSVATPTGPSNQNGQKSLTQRFRSNRSIVDVIEKALSVPPLLRFVDNELWRDEMKVKQRLGLVGSIILFLGVFAPIIRLPIVGNLNYFQNGKGDGVIVLLLSAMSLVLVLTKHYRALWFTGLGSMAVTIFTFVMLQLKLSNMRSQMATELAANPFRGIADLAMHSIQLQWGWALLTLGVACVIASATAKDTARERRQYNGGTASTGSGDGTDVHSTPFSEFSYLCSGCNTFQSYVAYCPNCGTPNPYHESTKARTAERILCESCGNEIKPDDKFCNSCGKAIVLR